MTIQKFHNGVMIEFTINGVPQPFIKIGVPKLDWPILWRPMKLLAQPSDKGLGDIVERTIGPVGGDAYNAWYKKMYGTKCPRCIKDKNKLNERYPL